jgi:hypothetical protein
VGLQTTGRVGVIARDGFRELELQAVSCRGCGVG